MKLSLINPPANEEKTLGKLKSIDFATPPLGLASLAGNIRAAGHDVTVVDAHVMHFGVQDCADAALATNPDVVAMGVMTPVAPLAHKLAAEIKRRKPSVTIIFGGVHPGVYPEKTLEDRNVDYVARGEAEVIIPQLLSHMDNGVAKVKGVSYRDGTTVVNNPNAPQLENLDELAFPAWDLFPLHRYRAPPHWDLKSPAFPVLTSRGCIFRCNFCSLIINGRGVRERSPKHVVDELDLLANKFGAREVMFWDPIFPFSKTRGLEICDMMIERGLHKKMVWMCETRVGLMDAEIASRMREAGCRRVAFGIESGVQELLNNIQKDQTLFQIRKGVEITKKAGIEVIGYFMLGLPGETRERSLETIRFAKELNPDFVKFNLTVPYPGTPLYNKAKAEGLLQTEDWERYSSFTSMTDFDPVFVPKDMTMKELLLLQKYAYKSFYTRPTFVLRKLTKMRSPRQVANNVKSFSTLVRGLSY